MKLFKRAIVVAAVAVLSAGLMPGATAAVDETTAGAASFADVPVTHPFYDEIHWMSEEGISTGYTDGTYRPAVAVSRQAMAAFLYRFAGEPEFEAPDVATFPDVPVGSDFYDEVEWLYEFEIADGYTDGTFRPTSAVSRQAMSAFIFRLVGEEYEPAGQTFPDVPVSSPFYPTIEWLYELEIADGYADGTFRPAAPVSRQAMAAFLFRTDLVLIP